MEAIRISTERAPAPGGWYSQAYKIGNLIYTAGVTANDPETQKMVAPGDIIGQTEQIINQPDNTVHARRFTPQRDDTSRTHNRDLRHPRPRQSWQPLRAAQLPTRDRRPSRESMCPRDGRSGYA